MNYKEHIERAIAYMEANLKAELSLRDLAGAAGYSEYHFIRVFKEVTGFTPADYLRKRRLSEIVRDMAAGGGPMSGIAFAYGFNSKENFTRAFKAEHNIPPADYRAAGNSLKLFDRFSAETPPFAVEPKIVTLEGFSLTVFPNRQQDGYNPPKFWNQYNSKKLSLRLSGNSVTADYGVFHWNDALRRMQYYIGIPTQYAIGNPEGTVEIHIPGGLYAMVATPPSSHFDFVNVIHKTWEYFLGVWMPQSGYQCAGWSPYQFETYVEASRSYSEDIYIPIEEKR